MISPWLNVRETAEYLRILDARGVPNLRAALKWLDRQRIPTKHRGRSVLVHRDDLNAALTVRRST